MLEFDSKRYQQESVLNRSAAETYEVRVRRSGVESDRFRERSKLFFYSMLMALGGRRSPRWQQPARSVNRYGCLRRLPA